MMRLRSRRPRAKPDKGNGAREALIAWAASPSLAIRVGAASSEAIADHLLEWLFDEGFKIVPFEADVAP